MTDHDGPFLKVFKNFSLTLVHAGYAYSFFSKKSHVDLKTQEAPMRRISPSVDLIARHANTAQTQRSAALVGTRKLFCPTAFQ